MVALTLPEAAKLAAAQGNYLEAGVVKIFASAAPLLMAWPSQNIPGMGLTYNKEGAMPGIAFRGANEPYTPSIGVINPETEVLKTFGGEIRVDNMILKGYGAQTREEHEALQIKAMAHLLSYTIIKGNSATDVKQFDGLERRLGSGSQVLSNSTSANGAALSIEKLDSAIDACEGPTHLLMLKKTRRRITAKLRGSASISTTRDEFGRQVTAYAGLPILVADEFGDTATLDESEAYTGGGTSDGTSIYVLRLEQGYLQGIQNGGLQVIDLGVLQSTPAVSTRVEWMAGMALKHPRAAVRLRDVDAALAAID